MKSNRKTVDDRHFKILSLLKEKGTIRADDIAENCGISLMTVRRDLQYLEEQGMLKRTHGGATLPERSSAPVIQTDLTVFCRDCISEYAAQFINDGDVLFINGSRTALNALKYVGDKHVTVYTNNGWAMHTSFPEHVTIIFTGGELRGKVMVGEYVMRNLLNITSDITFLGCAAVYEDGEFRYDIPTEIGINESMITHTRRSLYILCDHTKLQKQNSRDNLYGSCTYERDLTLITDNMADPDVIESLTQMGMHIIQVPVK